MDNTLEYLSHSSDGSWYAVWREGLDRASATFAGVDERRVLRVLRRRYGVRRPAGLRIQEYHRCNPWSSGMEV